MFNSQKHLLFTTLCFTFLQLLLWPYQIFAQPNPTTVPHSKLFSVSPEVLGQDKFRPLDEKIKPSPIKPKFVLPPLNQFSGENQKLSNSLRILVHKIELIGNTVFSKEELSLLTQPYENWSIDLDELQKLRQALTLYYISRGYRNSGAVIPDQKISHGILTIQIVEGKLTKINITGNHRLNSSYIDKRIAISKTSPLNINKLQEQLLLLQQNPLI